MEFFPEALPFMLLIPVDISSFCFLFQCMKVKRESELLTRVRLLATPWTAAYQAPPSMGFSRQEHWSGMPLPFHVLTLLLLLLSCFSRVRLCATP